MATAEQLALVNPMLFKKYSATMDYVVNMSVRDKRTAYALIRKTEPTHRRFILTGLGYVTLREFCTGQVLASDLRRRSSHSTDEAAVASNNC